MICRRLFIAGVASAIAFLVSEQVVAGEDYGSQRHAIEPRFDDVGGGGADFPYSFDDWQEIDPYGRGQNREFYELSKHNWENGTMGEQQVIRRDMDDAIAKKYGPDYNVNLSGG